MGLAQKSAILVAVLAAVYQFWFKGFVFDVLGVGRTVQRLEEFPWSCRRIKHSQFEGCEDLYLDENDRVLYAACSGSITRGSWNPGLSKYNVSGRRPQGSELLAVYIDEPKPDGQFRFHKIRPLGYEGAAGDQTLDLVGFDADDSKKGSLDFWLINHRPPVDAHKKYLDASKVGINVTVDVFRYKKGSLEMQHLKTISDTHIHSANNIALTGNGGMVVSNDHSSPLGFRKELDLVLGGGSVVYCHANQSCSLATPNSLAFPNGLTRGRDGLIYVPFTGATHIGVHRLTETGSLEQITKIDIGMPLDNLSVDSDGNIWAAALPRMFDTIEAIAEPFDKTAPSAIFKISKTEDAQYKVEQVLADGEGEVLGGATTAVFDRQTDRLFIGGAASPFLVECKAHQPGHMSSSQHLEQ